AVRAEDVVDAGAAAAADLEGDLVGLVGPVAGVRPLLFFPLLVLTVGGRRGRRGRSLTVGGRLPVVVAAAAARGQQSGCRDERDDGPCPAHVDGAPPVVRMSFWLWKRSARIIVRAGAGCPDRRGARAGRHRVAGPTCRAGEVGCGGIASPVPRSHRLNCRSGPPGRLPRLLRLPPAADPPDAAAVPPA